MFQKQKQKKAKSRQKKVGGIRKLFKTLNSLSSGGPSIYKSTASTQKQLEDAEKTLRDLGEETFPKALDAAPYLGVVFLTTSIILAKNIKQELF